MRITLKQPSGNVSAPPPMPFAVDATVGESTEDQLLRIMLA